MTNHVTFFNFLEGHAKLLVSSLAILGESVFLNSQESQPWDSQFCDFGV